MISVATRASRASTAKRADQLGDMGKADRCYDVTAPMPKGRSGRIILTAVFVIAGLVLLASATGRLPLLTRAWGPLGSSIADWTSSALATAPSPPADAGAAPHADASAPVRRQTAPLSSAQLGAPLVHGTFVASCGAPDDMKVTVNVAVKMGRATNVSVATQPANAAVASCIERAVRDVQWDASPKVDHVTVTY
jgi:hypothetical protein